MEQKRLLLVEDSDDDAFLFQRAVRQSGFNVDVIRADDGAKAKELLLEGPIPSLIVLDCNMPGVGGLEVLRYLRAKSEFHKTPIVMMSGTHSDVDVELAYAFGGNSFLTKPDDFREYIDRVIMLLAYWLGANSTSLPDTFAPSQLMSGVEGAGGAMPPSALALTMG